MKFFALVAFVAALGMASAAPSTRDLQSDLHEFVELIPIAEIKVIARKYIDSDKEVQQALAYLKGEEWQKLVTAVREHPTWIGFKEYLIEAGIDIEAIIQAIHDLIANARSVAAPVAGTRGMREMIDEIKAILPLGDILLLLNDKLEDSEDFQAFWAKISSEKSHAMVEEIRALPEVQRVAEVLRGFGLDIDKVLALIYGLFGWEV